MAPKLFEAPKLSAVEIALHLTEMGIQTTDQDVLKPQLPKVQRIYEMFVETYLGVKRTDMDAAHSQPSFAAVEQLEHPMLYMSALGLFTFYQQLAKVMAVVGVEDFSLRDLLRPEPARTQRCLSALINFWKFRNERLSFLQDFSARDEILAQDRQVAENEDVDITNKLAELRLQREEEEPATRSVLDNVRALNVEAKELRRQLSALANEEESLLQKKKDSEEKMSRMEAQVNIFKAECQKMRGQIVQSPERLKQLLVELGHQQAVAKSEAAGFERKFREVDAKVDRLNQFEQDVNKVMKLAEECEQLQLKTWEANRGVAEGRDAIEKQKGECKAMTAKLQQAKRQSQNWLDKVSRLQRTRTEKRSQLDARLKELRGEITKALEQCAAETVRRDEVETKAREIEMRAVELRRQHDAEMKSTADELNLVRARVELYLTEVKQSLYLPLAKIQ